MTKETILLVEDEAGICELIQLYLENKGYVVVAARTGEQALQLANSESPQIILLDIEMPGMDGFEVCKQIRKKMTVPILFISCRKEVADKLTCFELGGDDYLTKPFDFAELEARVRANLRRYTQHKQSLPSHILNYGKLQINLDNGQCSICNKVIPLSAKEMQLLILLAKHPNRIWSTEQLYDHVWGIDSFGDLSTVKVHISNLRRKLEENPSKPQFIQTVRGFGYLFAT